MNSAQIHSRWRMASTSIQIWKMDTASQKGLVKRKFQLSILVSSEANIFAQKLGPTISAGNESF